MKKLPEVNESKDNEKIELSNNQQNPGAAKASEFKIQSEELPGHGQRGDSKAEYSRLKRLADSKNRPTPDRNDPNNSAKPSTGSSLK
jgi:hypothetical protein